MSRINVFLFLSFLHSYLKARDKYLPWFINIIIIILSAVPLSTARHRLPPQTFSCFVWKRPASTINPRPQLGHPSILLVGVLRCAYPWFPFENLLYRGAVLCAIRPARCHFKDLIRLVMSPILFLLYISSFLIRSRRKIPSVVRSLARSVEQYINYNNKYYIYNFTI